MHGSVVLKGKLLELPTSRLMAHANPFEAKNSQYHKLTIISTVFSTGNGDSPACTYPIMQCKAEIDNSGVIVLMIPEAL